jgi:hypothetical protein
MLATDMDGGLRQHLPQEIRHQHSRLSEATDVPAVEHKAYLMFGLLF